MEGWAHWYSMHGLSTELKGKANEEQCRRTENMNGGLTRDADFNKIYYLFWSNAEYKIIIFIIAVAYPNSEGTPIYRTFEFVHYGRMELNNSSSEPTAKTSS